MPPKPKFQREEIVSAALDIVRECGIECLTTRNVGAKLNSSARPIFTVFKNMDELKQAVRAEAIKLYEQSIVPKTENTPLFKQLGMGMISFSINEPKLFRFLFMKQNKEADSFDDVFGYLGKTAEYCIEIIRKDYSLNRQEAYLLFESVWIYTYGVSSLCATGMCRFSTEQISKMLTTEFTAMLAYVRSGGGLEKPLRR